MNYHHVLPKMRCYTKELTFDSALGFTLFTIHKASGIISNRNTYHMTDIDEGGDKNRCWTGVTVN